MIIQMITRQYISSISAELGINLNVDYDFLKIYRIIWNLFFSTSNGLSGSGYY